MFKKSLIFLWMGLLVSATAVKAQEPEVEPKDKAGESNGPARFWQATLGGGHYMVALDRISSVSRHKYVLDGALIIDEVTVDTNGQALARFYFITPISAGTKESTVAGIVERGRELVDQAAERAGTQVQNMVVKKYPLTSHSKSIEYRVLSEAELTALYNSVRTAWETGRGRKFTAK
jgi:hypothetical protein